jgi:ferric-chelate reductase (NADPH)
MFLRTAQILSAESLSTNYRLIRLGGDALRGISWTPGDKIQVKMDGAMISRTYTPIERDRSKGQTAIRGYVHGNGPGSDWVSQAAGGTPS